MRSRTGNRLAGIVTALLICAAGAARAADPTVLDGVYTEAQAKRGMDVYNANCASCHLESLEGNPEAPALKGERFMETWRDDTLDGLYLHMKTRMPRRPGGDPGSLTEAQYADIVAYVLQSNGFLPGQKELAPAAMEKTMLIGFDGPKPLPNNALVMTVGCMEPVDAQNWMVSRAAEPTRAREDDEAAPDELKRAGAKALGTATFKLRLGTLMDDQPGFKPEALKGKKVLVKGALTWQTGNDRITVLSLVPMSDTCGQ